MNILPMSESCPENVDLEKLKKEIESKNLVGLCNNTKWNELLTAFRTNKWIVCNRSKWINGFISHWENDWFYHLPFPFLGVEWFDIKFEKTVFIIRDGGRYEEEINLKDEILKCLRAIGVEFEVTSDFVRVWGYAPKCYKEFNAKDI
ncbi:DUF6678 family protein [Shewanella cyperi]|uniref:DUF6678 family protein n=1 Tax=Shewanella cyperi TaxID=2814292 RepID=UPI001A94AF28|nr:DUF6678 family protein [Shewanella cyperi]QSX41535.1 hypothetical protein JYB84_03620 [Shewanella cyperi]